MSNIIFYDYIIFILYHILIFHLTYKYPYYKYNDIVIKKYYYDENDIYYNLGKFIYYQQFKS